VIPPGQSTTVSIEYDPTDKQGKQSSKVIIRSNDMTQAAGGRQGETHFPIKGFVKRAIERTPLGGLVIRSRDNAPGQVGRCRIENKMSEPMKPTVLRQTIKAVDFEIQEITPGMVYDVVARTNRELPFGKAKGEVVLATGLKREPEYKVHLSLRLFRKIEPTPGALFFRSDDTQKSRRKIDFHYYGDSPRDFQVSDFECPLPGIKITLTGTQAPPAWMSRLDPSPTAVASAYLDIPPGSELPKEDVIIKFKTTDPQMPVVDVLVTTNKPSFDRVMYGASNW
jgi:hypothetical protein